MSAYRTTRARWLTGIAVGCLVLAIALSHEPAVAGTSDAVGEPTLSVFVSIPLSRIQEGQFCQAYALVSGGTGTYVDFEWTGQFSGSGQPGPQGPGQIINGFVSSSPNWLRVDVEDSNGNTGWGIAENLQIDPSYPYNSNCEA